MVGNGSPLEEDEVIRRLDGRIIGPTSPREEETVQIEIAPDKDDQPTPSGIIAVKALTTEHTLLIADCALATSVVLAHDEKSGDRFRVSFSLLPRNWRNIRPHARRPSRDSQAHRQCAARSTPHFPVSSPWRKNPDVLWERPSLERFYARLEDEYEMKERADVLTRKLTVISEFWQKRSRILSIPSDRCDWN